MRGVWRNAAATIKDRIGSGNLYQKNESLSLDSSREPTASKGPESVQRASQKKEGGGAVNQKTCQRERPRKIARSWGRGMGSTRESRTEGRRRELPAPPIGVRKKNNELHQELGS